MSARFGLRAGQAMRSNFSQQMRFQGQRRMQSTVAETAQAEQSGFSKFFNSPVGPKTVHFWAPVMKWGLVLAGASDFTRPADQLSLTQNLALMCTGAIWTRWCFVIKPRNVFLASVNFLLFCVGATQVSRVLSYQKTLKGETLGQELKDEAQKEKNVLEKAIEDPKSIKDAIVGGK